MQILVDNGAYEFGNVGDVTMLMVAMRRLREMWPDARVNVLTANPDELQRLCPDAMALSVDGRNLWFQERNLLGPAYRLVPSTAFPALNAFERSMRLHMHGLAEPWIRRRVKRQHKANSMEHYLAAFHGADIVAASGGGYINDAFPRHAALVLETLQAAQNRGKITALLGQGIGPLTSPGLRRLARRVLPKVSCIGLREGRAAVPLLRELGVPETAMVVTGDDAIEAAYAGRAERLGEALGINVRVATYSGVDATALATIADAIATFRQQTQASIVPLPISFHEGDSDMRSIRAVFDRVGATYDAPDRADPRAIIACVAKCRTVLTGSYHAGVFALSQGIPVVALANTSYYEDKFYGLAEQFSGGVTVVRPEHGDALVAALTAAWDHADARRDALLLAAESQVRDGRDLYSRLHRQAHQPQGAA